MEGPKRLSNHVENRIHLKGEINSTKYETNICPQSLTCFVDEMSCSLVIGLEKLERSRQTCLCKQQSIRQAIKASQELEMINSFEAVKSRFK